jgi:hypothetical protein
MHKSFTLEDLVNYSEEVYKESHRFINKAIQKKAPSALVVRNILQYSRALRVKSGSGGPLFLIMN